MMDPKLLGLGFAANSSLSTFRNLGGLLQGHSAEGLDTILRLDSLGPSVSRSAISKGIKRKWECINGNLGQEAKQSLGHGVSHQSSSSSESKGSSITVCTAISSTKETKDESSVGLNLDCSLHLGSGKSPSLKKSAAPNLKPQSLLMKVDLELSLSTGRSESEITGVYQGSPMMQMGIEETFGIGGAQLDDESTLSLGKTENFLPPFHVPEMKESGSFFKPIPRRIDPSSFSTNLSASITSAPSSVICTSGITQLKCSSSLCKFTGCSKGARGASGLCITRGGGRRCQRPGCDKGAEGKTAFCKAHGGRWRCQFLGCAKSAEGRTEFCIAHGGGPRCGHEGCTKAARGKSGLCIRHGGGKRCQMLNCTKSAEVLSGLCISHGGGRRCQYPACTKGAQGSTRLCKAHGGGKRCMFEGCAKGAEGSTPFCKGHGGGKRCSFPGCPKSVHGGTPFCVAHGGGKRCAAPECTKSARGRTEYCVRHGGGKRCKFEGCGKSAQGSTDFCKAHGGGKRCSWGQSRSQFGNVDDGSCRSFARGKTGLCSMHDALIPDKRVHGGIILRPFVLFSKPTASEKIQTVYTDGDTNIDYEKFGRNEAMAAEWNALDISRNYFPPVEKASSSSAPEGRVHGGSFLSMLAGDSGLGSG